MKNGHTVQYTEEMEAYIRLKWVDEKWSAAVLARGLSELTGRPFSRNMVIGKVHRMGLSKPAKGRAPTKRVSSRGVRIVTAIHRIAPVKEISEPEPLGYRLWEIPKNGCKYPHGHFPYTFCGQETVDKSSYCNYHYAICYTQSRYKRRPTPSPSLGAQGVPAIIPPTVGTPL